MEFGEDMAKDWVKGAAVEHSPAWPFQDLKMKALERKRVATRSRGPGWPGARGAKLVKRLIPLMPMTYDGGPTSPRKGNWGSL